MATVVKSKPRKLPDGTIVRTPDGKPVLANPRKPWTVRYVHDGKQRERSFATQGEAREFKIKFEHDQREHVFVDPRNGKATFAEYAEQWVSTRKLAARTRGSYRDLLRVHINPVLGSRSLASVTSDPDEVRKLLWVTMPQRVGAMTIGQARGIILGVMNSAVADGKIAAHRLAGVEAPGSTARPEEVVISDDYKAEIARLADSMRADLQLTVWLMFGAGLRISEALAVNIKDFRHDGTVLRVSQQVGRDGQLCALKHRKPGDYRDVPVPGWLWAKVQAHDAEHGTDDGFLFRSRSGRMSYYTYKNAFVSAVKKVGLPGYHPHQLRHCYASTLLHAGVPISDLADWLGHHDVNVTHRTYKHLLPDSWTRGRDALEAIAA